MDKLQKDYNKLKDDFDKYLSKSLNQLQREIILNRYSFKFNQKYNLKVLNNIDPKTIISTIITKFRELLILKKTYPKIRSHYIFDLDIFRTKIKEGKNGVGNDVLLGTQIGRYKGVMDSAGYYSGIYFLYRYMIVCATNLLNMIINGNEKRAVHFCSKILNKKFIYSKDIIECLELFNSICMDLDGSNNSCIILARQENIFNIPKTTIIDSICFDGLKRYANDVSFENEKGLIEIGFKIPKSEIEKYRLLSTNSINTVVTKCITYINDNTRFINSRLAPSRKRSPNRRSRSRNSSPSRRSRRIKNHE